jgi:hypothetical protein
MKYVIKAEEALLKQTGKLTSHPHIFCVKCEGKTTAFGSNLQNKIQKAGSLGELLSSFECRSCRTAGKTKQERPKARKRNKGLSKQSKAAELVKNLPKMVFQERRRISLLEDPVLAAQVTAHACQRPDLFLNAGRKCIDCNLVSVCMAPCKNLGKQKLAA